MRWVLLAIAACSQPPAVKPAVAPPPPPPKRIAGPPAPVTCGEVGVILRGLVEDEREAGPMKEAAIARSCLHDAWSREVIECVGSATQPKPCLDKLTKAQQAGYHDRLLAWSDAYPDENLDIVEPEEHDDEPFVDCAQGIGDVSHYAPALTAPRRELAVSLRRFHLLELCEEWDTTVRACFADGKAPAACRTLLDPDQERDVVDRLAGVDTLMTKVAAVKAPTCAAAVKAHYADAKWSGVLTKRKDRAQIIAKSRKAMLDACAADSWSENLRACLIAGGDEECFHATGVARWGYPPAAVPVKTGIPECDAYGDVLRALTTCTAIPRSAVQTMLESFNKSADSYDAMSPADRSRSAASCQQSEAAMRQSATSLGCSIP